LPNCCGQAADTGGTSRHSAGFELVVGDGGALDSAPDQIAIQTVGQVALGVEKRASRFFHFHPTRSISKSTLTPTMSIGLELNRYVDRAGNYRRQHLGIPLIHGGNVG
jgi:hypothetical protein